MAKIFISYRREDSRWPAERLFLSLQKYVAKDDIFMDVDSLKPGEVFADKIHITLAKIDVMLVLIGPKWANGERENSRLFDVDDFVRIEIESALRRNARIIPVLVDNTQLPDSSSLPKALQPLIERQSQVLSQRTFEFDTGRLAGALGLSESKNTVSKMVLFGVASAIVVGAVLSIAMLGIGRASQSTDLDTIAENAGTERMEEMRFLELVLGELPIETTVEQRAALVRRCDELAGHHLDVTLPADIPGKSITEVAAVAEEAIEKCSLAVRAEPNNSRALMNLSRAMLAMGEYPARMPVLERASELGSVRATVGLGLAHFRGRGTFQDYNEAKRYFDLAVDRGDAPSLSAQAVFSSRGILGPVNKETAFQLYSQSARRGYDRAQYSAGIMHLHGVGTEVDARQSAFLLIQAVENSSDPLAQTQLGWAYENGYGVGFDLSEAQKLYQSAVADGHRLSNINLARLELAKGSAMNHEAVVNYVADYVSPEFDPIFDDVYWIYEDNPSFAQMIVAFLEEFSVHNDQAYVSAHLASLISRLTAGFQRGEYPKNAIIPQISGAYVPNSPR